ncbi:MAG: S41 family peptidase [Proteobacteria bacterium]|nr:S41 family peptidase [Pseudomonadota bacterium]
MDPRSHVRTLLILVTGLACGFSAALALEGFPVRPLPPPPPAMAAPQLSEAAAFAEVYEHIRRDYVDDIDDHTLMDKAMRGMVASLDPHSAFLGAEEYEEVRLSTMGAYPGVGIEVAPVGGVVRVVKPIPGSPAHLAGIVAGDELVAIDGREIGTDLAGAIARLRGDSGSLVHLTLRRSGTAGLLEFALRRAEVEVPSVSFTTLEPGYAYVRISTFSETTPDDLSRAVLRLKRDNPDGIRGLVLDLRNNPGGVLEAGVEVADDFLESGVIVTADGRTPEARFEMDAAPGDLIDGAPLVVLVNAGSASASEIVAGALKDHDRALLVGRRTYGKGSVQTVMPLLHGGAVKLTTSRYFTPSGTSIHGRGILPDVPEDGDGAPPQDIDAGPATAPLAVRDPDVRLGLEVLKHDGRVHRGPAASLAARLAVP